MANWAKNARIITRLDFASPMGHRSRIQLPWSLVDEKQCGELASLELPDHSPEIGRRMSWLYAARRDFENHGRVSPFETRVVGRGFERVHTRRGL